MKIQRQLRRLLMETITQRDVDNVLDKILEKGMQSLTPDDKLILKGIEKEELPLEIRLIQRVVDMLFPQNYIQEFPDKREYRFTHVMRKPPTGEESKFNCDFIIVDNNGGMVVDKRFFALISKQLQLEDESEAMNYMKQWANLQLPKGEIKQSEVKSLPPFRKREEG